MTAPPWRDVAMPEQMQGMARDARGYPVPYVVLWVDGKPQFVVNDAAKVARATEHFLCHICGASLAVGPRGNIESWFTGGPASALLNVGVGVYRDGAMHRECLRYAMQVCPYLAHRSTVYISDIVGAKLAERPDAILTKDQTMIPGTPDLFVAVESDWKYQGGMFLAAKPYRKVEYWRDGVLLEKGKGRGLALASAQAMATEKGIRWPV